MTVLKAAAMVGVISLCNGFGRVLWAFVSDYIGRAQVYFLLFLIQAVIFFLLPRIHDWTLFTLCFAVIGLCYGGGFGTMPSFTADFFGSKYMGGIYGIVLLAWGLAAVPSPIMIARIHQNLGRYAPAVDAITIVMVVALVFPVLARWRPGKSELSTTAAAISR